MAFRYDRLKTLRKEKGYKQVSLAKALHTGRSTLAMWETGQSEPTNEMCSRIAELLDCSVGYLLGTEDEVNAIKAFDALRAEFLASSEGRMDRLRSIGKQLTGQASGISEIEFALSGEIHDLTEDEMRDVLDYVRFKRAQKVMQEARHDD